MGMFSPLLVTPLLYPTLLVCMVIVAAFRPQRIRQPSLFWLAGVLLVLGVVVPACLFVAIGNRTDVFWTQYGTMLIMGISDIGLAAALGCFIFSLDLTQPT